MYLTRSPSQAFLFPHQDVKSLCAFGFVCVAFVAFSLQVQEEKRVAAFGLFCLVLFCRAERAFSWALVFTQTQRDGELIH